MAPERDIPITTLTSSENGRLPRRQKRILVRAGKNAYNERPALTIGLTSEQEILLYEDDLPFLINEVKLHQSAQAYTIMEIRAYNALIRLGVTDSNCKKFLLEFGASDSTTNNVYEEINKRNREGMIDMMTVINNMRRQQKRYYDPDEADVINSLIEDDHISGKDVLIEIKRARGESIGLMNLQIEWLKEKRALELKQAKIDRQAEIVATEQSLATLQSLPEDSSEIDTSIKQKIEKPSLLKGWRLFITKSPWSSDPQQLTHISTNSRQETLEGIIKFTKGKASIKPNSILNALEFHLRKDIIQRALAARNKYGPDGIKDWVKIKRGGDRIFFLIPKPNEAQAIFFIEGRDVIYR